MHRRLIPLLLLAGGASPGLVAQGVILAPAAPQGAQRGMEDEGRAVEMFESPNLDRYLRKAQTFLHEENFGLAIQVLQDVIEGNTVVAAMPPPGEGETPPAGTEQPPQPANGTAAPANGRPPTPSSSSGNRPGADPAAPAPSDSEVGDPARTVFSQDGRIYRPVRRLCHELLAAMPPAGLELYRSLHEASAQELLDQAVASGLTRDLEAVANRYFATLAAGRAMQLLADRLMHEGRYRAAVQVLHDLAELYPKTYLARLGIAPVWCEFKIAVCLRFAGESGAAREQALRMASDFPDESLRVMGELQPVSDLAQSPLLVGDTIVTQVGPAPTRPPSWVTSDDVSLVPLWQYRYRTPDPYGGPTQKRQNNPVSFGETYGATAAPPASKYGTGTQVAFVGDEWPRARAVFLDHFRLRIADAFTGLLLAEGDGEDKVPPVQDGRPRVRVPAYDFALQTVVEDDESYFAVLGFPRASQSIEVLKENSLVAYDKQTGARRWSTEDFQEGEDGYRDVTFLAAPAVFGERLLAPVLRRDAYSLQALDRRTGKPLWCTRIHAGGSSYFKAPGSPVLVRGSLVYVLTNAGALAAVDAFTGDLRWIRKHERSHPLRERPVTRRVDPREQNMMFRGMVFFEQDLPSFLPSDVYAGEGTVIFAPCDGNVAMCLDGASGQPIWMIDGSSRYASYGRLQYVVGVNSRFVYFASESDLVCVGRDSGVRLWSRPLPSATNSLTRWRGRGSVQEDFVLMPGDREVLLLDAEGQGDWRRLPLPAFGVGDAPLGGPNNVFLDGPWLAIAYAGGIEVYSSVAALLDLAAATTDVGTRATMLVQAGHVDQAMDVLEQALAKPIEDAAERRRLAEQLVALGREVALRQGRPGIAALDRVRPFAADRQVRMLWHLARLELWKQVQDMQAYEEEQLRLYRLMEGKD